MQHLFFDLDRTLWDFETNSRSVLEILFREYDLQRYFPNFLLFFKRYKEVNEEMWQQYYRDEITKDDVRLLRFYHTLRGEKEMCAEMSQNYIETSVMQTGVFPDTYEVLTELKQRAYTLHIISNGFREVQETKLRNCKLNRFFTTITTSEDSGYHKPKTEAFEFALQQANATIEISVMIGDDLNTDIVGGVNAGLFTVYFNPQRKSTPHKANAEIYELKSLLNLFK